MERKGFIRSLLLGAVSAPVIIDACKKDSSATTTNAEITTNTGSVPSNCVVAPSETQGPFPTKSPATYLRSDIRDGREGHEMTVKIAIGNINDNCVGLEGAIVDIWHCDAEGAYSEYGGSGMQSVNYQSLHFLGGRQITDSQGVVNFTTIFPGWYPGRATHIHVHIFDATGNSLKATQIAFPEGSGSAVAIVNGYAKELSGYTSNSKDNVFSDDKAGTEIAKVSGSVTGGFALETKINVPA